MKEWTFYFSWKKRYVFEFGWCVVGGYCKTDKFVMLRVAREMRKQSSIF